MSRKNLVNASCASVTEVWRHIKDWLVARNGIADYSATGLGWTVHDSYYAGGNQDSPAADDWVVVKSAGEDGNQDLYCRILFSSLANSIVRLSSGLYWDASTNAWVCGLAGGTDWPHGPYSGSTFNVYIYGDLNGFAIIIGNGTSFYGRYFGLLADALYDTTVAITSGSVTAGSNKVVTVDAVPSSWAVGRKVFIRDNAHIEPATIAAISGYDVTLASLANGYASGAKLSSDYPLAMSYMYNFVYRVLLLINHAGVIGSSPTYADWLAYVPGACNPDPLNNDPVAVPILIGNAAGGIKGYYGRMPDMGWCNASGMTAGQTYSDHLGDTWRALSIEDQSTYMIVFREV